MIRTNNISFSYTEYEKTEELAVSDKELVDAAREIAVTAYAPYSKFRVGAAVRLESGKIICGANVENAAFPSGICAERSALSNSVSNYPEEKPVAIAIAAMTEEGLTDESTFPMRQLQTGYCRRRIKNWQQNQNNFIREEQDPYNRRNKLSSSDAIHKRESKDQSSLTIS